ncbi:MAG: hypothetical protein SFW36_07245, partial [Leptolyngbyaceae cyanobacterium bins.59]|nr:hypothetical protein [Leptolyngbyaceae cyanobacterium bins.59]
QFVLHALYGEETFLYSLHFLPLLIGFAALSTLTNTRWIALTLAIVLTFLAGINNIQQFKQATDNLQMIVKNQAQNHIKNQQTLEFQHCTMNNTISPI